MLYYYLLIKYIIILAVEVRLGVFCSMIDDCITNIGIQRMGLLPLHEKPQIRTHY
jgi:hypothetical protein